MWWMTSCHSLCLELHGDINQMCCSFSIPLLRGCCEWVYWGHGFSKAMRHKSNPDHCVYQDFNPKWIEYNMQTLKHCSCTGSGLSLCFVGTTPASQFTPWMATFLQKLTTSQGVWQNSTTDLLKSSISEVPLNSRARAMKKNPAYAWPKEQNLFSYSNLPHYTHLICNRPLPESFRWRAAAPRRWRSTEAMCRSWNQTGTSPGSRICQSCRFPPWSTSDRGCSSWASLCTLCRKLARHWWWCWSPWRSRGWWRSQGRWLAEKTAGTERMSKGNLGWRTRVRDHTNGFWHQNLELVGRL